MLTKVYSLTSQNYNEIVELLKKSLLGKRLEVQTNNMSFGGNIESGPYQAEVLSIENHRDLALAIKYIYLYERAKPSWILLPILQELRGDFLVSTISHCERKVLTITSIVDDEMALIGKDGFRYEFVPSGYGVFRFIFK